MRSLPIQRAIIPFLLFSQLPYSAALNLGLESLEGRAVQSQATCLNSFDWMDNSLSQSPCIVAAYLLSSCAGGDWTIQAVTANSHYTPPGKTDANGCKCSWVVYNTLQACADCQGQNFESAMLSWSGYNGNCTGSLLSTKDYYPPQTPIPAETAVPFWATTNPSTWHDGIFDPSMAQSIANRGNSDITQSTRPGNANGKKSNKGAIAGGVIGGIVFLVFVILAFLFIRSRRNRRQAGTSVLNHQRKASTVKVRWSPLSHFRSPSENYTGKYGNPNVVNGLGYDNLTPSPGPTMMSMTMTGGSTGTTPSGRPPYHTMPSSSSFTSAPTASPPPGDYITHTTPGKAYLSVPPGIGVTPGMGMVTMNNNSNNHSSALSMTVSSAYATAGAPSTTAGRVSHAHTLSNDSTAAFSLNSGYNSNLAGMEGRGGGGGVGGEPPEGTITPFVLPPTLPEPMGPGHDVDNSPSFDAANPVSPTPGTSGKSGLGHGRGASDSTTTSNDVVYSNPTPSPLIGSGIGTGTRRLAVERRNPPAYTLSPPDLSSEHGHIVDTEDAQSAVGDRMSTDAQRAETTLSGTTLRNREGDSSVRAPTTVGEEVGASQVDHHQNANADSERDQHGYPIDRKI